AILVGHTVAVGHTVLIGHAILVGHAVLVGHTVAVGHAVLVRHAILVGHTVAVGHTVLVRHAVVGDSGGLVYALLDHVAVLRGSRVLLDRRALGRRRVGRHRALAAGRRPALLDLVHHGLAVGDAGRRLGVRGRLLALDEREVVLQCRVQATTVLRGRVA